MLCREPSGPKPGGGFLIKSSHTTLALDASKMKYLCKLAAKSGPLKLSEYIQSKNEDSIALVIKVFSKVKYFFYKNLNEK